MARAKAISYLRVSGKGQVEGDGFERQRQSIARFAKAAKYEIVEEFRDEGVSGTKELDARPGLAALLDRIESNGVKVVIVERADRLARRPGTAPAARMPTTIGCVYLLLLYNALCGARS